MARPSKSPAVQPRLDGSASVYLFFGDEPFLRRLYLNKLIERALGGKDGGESGASMALSQFQGGEVPLAAVLDELRTLPFLAERRVVIVQDADPFIKDHRERLEKYVEGPCPTGILVLLAEKSQANTNLFKKIAARGGAVACERLAQSELAGWIRARAKDVHGKTLDYETASLLADLVGDDLDRLDSELVKLATFLGERKTITAEDVDVLVANHRLHDAFELTGAVSSRDVAAALVRWNDMLAKDNDASYRTVGLIAWQLRQLLRARQLRGQGLSRDEVLSRLRVPPFVRERFAEQVNNFNERRLRGLVSDLVSVDLAAKTGGASPERGIEQFIIAACREEGK